MKKILTLMMALAAFGAVHAQSSREEARRVVLGENRNERNSERSRDIILGDGNDNRTYPNSYPSSGEARVDQINREYDAKIYSIRTNNTLSRSEKERIIRQLESERARKIRQVNSSYGERDYNKGKAYGKNKKFKSNNGKHKGWHKGKGNKHRDRDDD